MLFLFRVVKENKGNNWLECTYLSDYADALGLQIFLYYLLND